MAITFTDLGTDETTGRRVLVHARRIAPCVDGLTGQAKADAIAILKGVVAELPEAGSARLKSMSRNGTSLTFDIASAFSGDATTNLKSLCTVDTVPGLPRGSFPAPLPAHTSLWPEGEYTP